MAKKQQSIFDQLNLSDYKNYDSIPPAKKAWITIKAKQQGKDPDKVHSDIERKMGGSKKAKKKITTSKTTKKVGKKKTKKKGNMYELSIEQWNPFVGCKFDCIYCEASFKRQAKRQKQRCIDCYNYTPHTHPNRLNTNLPKTSKDEFVFTCASGDVSFCSVSFLKKIIKRIEDNPNKTFLIQSKNPKTFKRTIFPDNVILGITLETNRDKLYSKIGKAPKPSQRFKDFLKIYHPRKMITIEPILDFDLDVMIKWMKKIKPVVVWMGYDSKKGCDLPEPKLKKFNSLKNALVKAGIKVKMKTVREGR